MHLTHRFCNCLTSCLLALTGITPVLVSETSAAEHRGGFLGYVFIANCKSHLQDALL